MHVIFSFSTFTLETWIGQAHFIRPSYPKVYLAVEKFLSFTGLLIGTMSARSNEQKGAIIPLHPPPPIVIEKVRITIKTVISVA